MRWARTGPSSFSRSTVQGPLLSIPEENQRLSQRIGRFHAAALTPWESLYYSREEFDDFYFGKGSTYPDAMGSSVFFFEQASARGNAQSTDQESSPLSKPSSSSDRGPHPGKVHSA